jgi:regulator of nucleoside diphosphate kinase
MREPSLIITDKDLALLLPVLDQNDTPLSESLEGELRRASIVAHRDVPADVVTMNSEVTYEDVATGARRTIRVVFPRDADASAGRVSVLAPIAAALLGLRVGQEIDWRVPRGMTRLRVVEVGYQPEAAAQAES